MAADCRERVQPACGIHYSGRADHRLSLNRPAQALLPMTQPASPAAPPIDPHAQPAASPWVQRWSHLVAPHATVLDVACGSGRHTRWFAARGCAVTAVDRDAAALQGLLGVARTVVADIEGEPWPLPGERFGAVVVTNYLWRALLPDIAQSIADAGVLIYETFATGNARIGKPSNPNFLLRPGELLQFAAAQGLHVVAYENGFASDPDRCIQRLVATRHGEADAELHRFALSGG